MGKSKTLKSDKAIKKVVREAETNDTHVELVNVLYSKLKKIIEDKGQNINASTILIIIDTSMKLASEYKTLSGLEKKAIVITVVKKLIDESNLSEEDQQVLDIVVENLLDVAIDQLYIIAPQVYGKIKAGCSKFCIKK